MPTVNLCVRCSKYLAVIDDTYCQFCDEEINQSADLQAEEFDKFLDKTTEDGIPLWQIQERNLHIQQEYEENHDRSADAANAPPGD